jgi:predicted aldo/keto reductase-like oxidoreductase
MKTTFNHKGINYELQYELDHDEIQVMLDGKDLLYEDEDLFLEIFAASEFHITEQQEEFRERMREEYYEAQLQEDCLNYDFDHGY